MHVIFYIVKCKKCEYVYWLASYFTYNLVFQARYVNLAMDQNVRIILLEESLEEIFKWDIYPSESLRNYYLI